jgi:methionine sulfoxide reductase heme-binding subunit
MRFRGMSETTALTRWGLSAIAIGLVVGMTLPSALAGLAAAVASHPESVPWVASRMLGFLAYLAIAGSTIWGVLLSTKLLDAIAHRPVTFALHQDLAAIGVGLAGVHGVLLALDRTVPASLASLVVPFTTEYRPLWVGIGQLAFWLSVVVIGSFYVRRRIGPRTWRLIHYATILTFVGATAHGIGAGTDEGTLRWLYLVAVSATTFLFAYRIVTASAARRSSRARSERMPARSEGEFHVGRSSPADFAT